MLAAVGVGAFSAGYESFSHGVASPFMVYAFMIPLVLGAGPALAFDRAGVAVRPQLAAVITLTAGSLVQGALEIYGTSSPWMVAYPVAGGLWLVAAVWAVLPGRPA